MNIPSREVIERLREKYPYGARVELEYMDDPQAPPIGTRGTVAGVDDAGQIVVSWDNGSSLSVIYGVDQVRKLFVIPRTVVRQTLKVRDTGKTNMFDIKAVQKIAMELGFQQLFDFTEQHRCEYMNLIMYGDEEV